MTSLKQLTKHAWMGKNKQAKIDFFIQFLIFTSCWMEHSLNQFLIFTSCWMEHSLNQFLIFTSCWMEHSLNQFLIFTSCWMSLDAFYYSFVIPVGFIILANLAVFIRVTVKLCRRKDMSKHSSKSTNQNVVNIRSSFISFCVLGKYIAEFLWIYLVHQINLYQYLGILHQFLCAK